MNFDSMDKVIWYRKRTGTPFTHQMVPATVYYRAKNKVVIKVEDCTGAVTLRFVKPEEIEHVHLREGVAALKERYAKAQ